MLFEDYAVVRGGHLFSLTLNLNRTRTSSAPRSVERGFEDVGKDQDKFFEN